MRAEEAFVVFGVDDAFAGFKMFQRAEGGSICSSAIEKRNTTL